MDQIRPLITAENMRMKVKAKNADPYNETHNLLQTILYYIEKRASDRHLEFIRPFVPEIETELQRRGFEVAVKAVDGDSKCDYTIKW